MTKWVRAFQAPFRYTRRLLHQTVLDATKVLVIVESPTKCATIEKLLNTDPDKLYTVLSCYGHVRNLKKNTKIETKKFPYPIHGIDLDNNYAPIYDTEPKKKDVVRALKKAVKESDMVILANDADREGEAMAWHLAQILDLKSYQRIRFTEITKSALQNAVAHPDAIDDNLVAAQETRRVLDRLAGYTVSPILWKKIAPGLSAGRVQSVGLSRIVQREKERLRFETTEYYDLSATLENSFTAKLVSINNQAVANSGKDFTSQGRQLVDSSRHKLHLQTETQANDYVNLIRDGEWRVVSIDSRRRNLQPPQPYKTSTLQRDAVSKLGWSVDQTMSCAQRLYENGHISYMRTDSTIVSEEASAALESTITNQFGSHMLSEKKEQKSTKHSQEAHEAIRPALQADGTFRQPEQLNLDGPMLSLYRLIYQRTLAYRMPPLVTNQTQVVIQASRDDTTMEFRASGSVVVSPGYTVLYENSESETQKLPSLKEGQLLHLSELCSVGHETQPPPRFTEASFVKELEDLGIGRPSTYAGTVQILRDRAYVGVGNVNLSPSRKSREISGPAISAVRAAGGADVVGGSGRGPMVPSLSAFAVCSFLEKHCPNFVDPDFTARMEERLDEIASGNPEATGTEQRVAYLDEFYAGENGLAAKIKHIEDSVDGSQARRLVLPALEKSNDHNIGLFIGPWGPYIRELSEPADEDTKVPSVALPPALAAEIASIDSEALKAALTIKRSGGPVLGQHPVDGRPIRLKTGRFGAYLQWGEDDDEDASTHSLPREKSRLVVATPEGISGITLEEAIGYCELPRTVCTLNEMPITAAIGPYGQYLKYNKTYTSLSMDHDVLTISPATAERIVIENIIEKKNRLGRGVLLSLGDIDGSSVTVKSGRYGAFLNWKKINAPLPDVYKEDMESISLEEAWSLMRAKIANGPSKKGRKSSRKKGDVALPPAPKRPISAYLHFCAEKRPDVAKTAKSLGEISTELAKLWKSTPAEARQQYEILAAASKEDYESRKAEWEETVRKLTGDASSRVNGAAKVKRNAPNSAAPKRPRSAYLYFCSANRQKVAEKAKTLGEISKELARQWAVTNDRSEYEEAALADKKRYEDERARYEEERGLSSRYKSNGQATTNITAMKKPSTPRAPSAYMLFCKEQRQSLFDGSGEKLSFGETTKRLAEMWNDCDETTRAKFQSLAAEEKEKLMVLSD